MRTRITTEGWCYLILLGFVVGGAMIREINLLLIMAGIMAGPVLLSWRWLARMMGRFAVERKLPNGVGAGEVFSVAHHGTNRHRGLGVWATRVENTISKVSPKSNQKTNCRLLFPYVAPRTSETRNYDCRIPRRGLYEFGPMKIVSSFPLGLLRRATSTGSRERLYVYPPLGRLRREWLENLQDVRSGNQRSQHRHGLTEGDFHSLRDWRNSDSRRWIHWRTSARRNKLTVRQFERRQNRSLAIFLNVSSFSEAYRQRRTDSQIQEDVDRAVEFVATAVAMHCRLGSSRLLLGIAANSIEIVSGTASTALMMECMEKLAVVDQGDRDRLPDLVWRSLRHIEADRRIVIIGPETVDLMDTERFARVWDEPSYRNAMARAASFATEADQIAHLFEPIDAVALPGVGK